MKAIPAQFSPQQRYRVRWYRALVAVEFFVTLRLQSCPSDCRISSCTDNQALAKLNVHSCPEGSPEHRHAEGFCAETRRNFAFFR